MAPRPHWQHTPEQRMYETRMGGVHLKVFETMFGSYSYSVVKDGKFRPGNVPTLDEAKETAEWIAREL